MRIPLFGYTAQHTNFSILRSQRDDRCLAPAPFPPQREGWRLRAFSHNRFKPLQALAAVMAEQGKGVNLLVISMAWICASPVETSFSGFTGSHLKCKVCHILRPHSATSNKYGNRLNRSAVVIALNHADMHFSSHSTR